MQEAVDVANHQYRTCQEKDYTVTLTRVLDEKMGDLALRLPGLALNAGLTSSIDAEISVNVVIEELNMTAIEIYDANNKIPGKISTSYKTHAGFTANNKKYEIKCWIEISPVKFQIDPKKVQSGVPFKLNDNGTDTIPFTDGATLPFFRDVPPPVVIKDAEEKKEEGWLGKGLDFTNKQFNFGADLTDGIVTGYNKIENDFLRSKYHKLSKLSFIKWKSGEMFQKAEKWIKGGTKFGKYAGPAGTLLSAGMVWYEIENNKWDAHTIVDGAMVAVAGTILIIAAVTTAPVTGTAAAILMGFAAYGVIDYTLDASGWLDTNFGRKSELWD